MREGREREGEGGREGERERKGKTDRVRHKERGDEGETHKEMRQKWHHHSLYQPTLACAHYTTNRRPH